MKFVSFFCVALLLAGCHRSFLEVRTEALYPSYLASEKIDTPDPCRLCFSGEQIVIHWRIPRDLFPSASFHLLLTLRYGDFSFASFTYPLSDWSGYWTFQLLNQQYWEKGGILSFKVELYRDNEVFDTWKHHIWAEWIQHAAVQEGPS